MPKTHILSHRPDRRRKYDQNLDDPIYNAHTYGLDLQRNEIYLFGREEYSYGACDMTPEPGVEYTMANQFIKNIRMMQLHSSSSILVHMKTCFSGKTVITTNDGYKKIRDIQIGDMVLTHTGEYHAVTDVMSKMYDGDMIKLHYGRKKNNATAIRATAEHPIWVERDGTRSWMSMSKVIPGDIIFVESKKCDRTGESIPYWRNVKNYNADRLRRVGNSPQTKKFEKRILEECVRLQQDGWTVVPTDMGVRPDIVGFKDGKITVFEVENMKGKSLEVKKEKYNNAPINDYVDDIVWITPDTKAHYTWYDEDDSSPFIKVKVTGTKRWKNKYKQCVYNLTVGKDNSYVANHVVVHNCGGLWEEGMAIYDAIASCPNSVTVLSYTHARSMSSLIPLAADRFVMMPHSTYMIHEGTFGFEGTQKQLRTEYYETNKAMEEMLNIYVARLKSHGKYKNKAAKWIRELLVKKMNDKEEFYLDANEAVDIGFADSVFGDDGLYDWKSLREFDD